VSDVSTNVRGAVFWGLLALATVVVCAGLQWFVPERSVQPVAVRFMCDGPVEVVPASATRETEVVGRVYCLNGVRREDVTYMTLVVFAIPVALVIATSAVLVRRLVIPRPKTRLRRAPL